MIIRFTPQELISNFELLGEWEERYGYLIDLGKHLPKLPDEDHNEKNFLSGCVSKVWLVSRSGAKDEPLILEADSDAMIVKGLVNLLLGLCRGLTAEEILTIPFAEVMEEIGLSSHLSPNRRNGFVAMIGRIRELAQNHLNQTTP